MLIGYWSEESERDVRQQVNSDEWMDWGIIRSSEVVRYWSGIWTRLSEWEWDGKEECSTRTDQAIRGERRWTRIGSASSTIQQQHMILAWDECRMKAVHDIPKHRYLPSEYWHVFSKEQSVRSRMDVWIRLSRRSSRCRIGTGYSWDVDLGLMFSESDRHGIQGHSPISPGPARKRLRNLPMASRFEHGVECCLGQGMCVCTGRSLSAWT